MSNYDQFAAAVKEISGGKNIVLLDDLGLPSVYVPINKLKNSEIISGGSENTHPAFSVDGVEKSRFLYSKYQNIIINGRAYSCLLYTSTIRRRRLIPLGERRHLPYRVRCTED